MFPKFMLDRKVEFDLGIFLFVGAGLALLLLIGLMGNWFRGYVKNSMYCREKTLFHIWPVKTKSSANVHGYVLTTHYFSWLGFGVLWKTENPII